MEQTTALIAITSAVSALIAVVATKGVDGIIKLWREKHVHNLEDRREESNEQERLVARLELRIVALEAALSKVNTEHLDCIRTQERFRGQVEQLQKTVDRLQGATMQVVTRETP